MLKRFSLNFAILSLAGDIGLALLALAIATALRERLPYGPRLNAELVPLRVYIAAALIWTVVFVTLSVYDPRRTLRAVDEIQKVIAAQAIAALCLAGFVFFSFQEMSRFLFLYFVVVDSLLLLSWRVLYRLVRRVGNGRLMPPRKVLIIGAGKVGRRTLRFLVAATIVKPLLEFYW